MKKYKVIISETAKKDLVDIYNFITIEYENEFGAVKVLWKIRDKCNSLSFFPKVKPIMMTYKNINLRLVRAEKYSISYFVDDTKSKVVIYRIMSSKRDVLVAIIKNQ